MAEFDDGKDADALRTIGEVSEALDIKPHVLRYWEQQFSVLNPLKRSGGRRYYRPSDVALVESIDRLVNEEGYTIKGAEAVLRASGGKGLDRRREDRRSGDRRAGSEVGEGSSGGSGQSTMARATQANVPDTREALAKLKAIRARLAKAIEA